MSIMNILAQIMSGQVQVDPKIKSQIAMAMAGQEPQAPQGASGPALQQPQSPQFTPAPAADPRVSPQQPIQSVNSLGSSPVASVMAGQDQPEGVPPQQEPQQAPMQAPQQASQGVLNQPQEGPGILSQAGSYLNNAFGLDQPDLISRIGYGLGVAGSQDPFKALMMLKEQQGNEAKQVAERRRAMQPKFTRLQGGAFTQVEIPGQLPFDIPNEKVQEFIAKTSEAKSVADLQRQLLVAQAGVDNKNKVEMFQKTVTEAGGATTKAEFNPSVQRSIDKLDGIIVKLPAINTTTVPGVGSSQNPLLASVVDNASGAVGMGTEGFKVRRDLEKYFNEQVAADLKQLGANPTDTDLRFKQKPIPKAGDPIEYQIEYVREMRERLNESETRRTGAAKRRDEISGSSSTAPTLAPAAGISNPTSKAAYDALPAGTQYVAPDGKTYTKR